MTAGLCFAAGMTARSTVEGSCSTAVCVTFLLELGAGFPLIGRQAHLVVGDQDFYLDLLFYHLKLRCFVVIDLKARDFTPEAAGKMNFYLSAVDDQFRQPTDQPSMGLILCRSKNRIIAEYALRDLTKPIGVSGQPLAQKANGLKLAASMQRILFFLLWPALGSLAVCSAEVLRYHTLVVDGQNKILPWHTPSANAFDNYLDQCWAWAVAAPNDTHGLPISFLYCAWRPGYPPTADTGWENDVGEKIPNWVESARLYYQYSGDRAPLDYVKRLVDYSLEHGQTPANHVWPSFPVGTSNAGDTEFRGFTGVWALWDCHVDLAADIGWVMYRLYQVYGDAKYRDKAIHVANVLVANMVPGTANDSASTPTAGRSRCKGRSQHCRASLRSTCTTLHPRRISPTPARSRRAITPSPRPFRRTACSRWSVPPLR